VAVLAVLGVVGFSASVTETNSEETSKTNVCRRETMVTVAPSR
jgi:hypothetical protein